MGTVPPATIGPLEPRTAERVRDLAASAAAADAVAPLSETTLLALDDPTTGAAARHLVAVDSEGLLGYAQSLVTPAGPSAEVVVHPAHRHQGWGRSLLGRLLDADPATRFWAHGDLPAAAALARSAGLTAIRSLHLMTVTDWPDAAGSIRWPAGSGLTIRAFRPGIDDAPWLALNAVVFAEHAEQGALTQADLDARIRQPWFDPDGFLLLVQESDPGQILGYHWTKSVDPGHGEVYVVGLDPAWQGRGLAAALTASGVDHLWSRGAREVSLYVDGENLRAVSAYRRLGFTVSATDRMYALR
jgi:mycothiol synthase